MSRIFLRPTDLQILEELKDSQCYKIYRKLKDSLGKQKHQKVTFSEYAAYRGIKVEEVMKVMNNI